ncbi:hypothetical protein M885DRAFT_619559 [Pelagophyceae sp. CCMP2097]|nr:hypothetical protein M885DRAFT_619559 [Pelagophyceae sp. CCMP2097]
MKQGSPARAPLIGNSEIEIVILASLCGLSLAKGAALDVAGSAHSFRSLLAFKCAGSVLRRAYTWYLEYCYDAFPKWRTQPARKRAADRDVTGRTEAELKQIENHDFCTMIAMFCLDFGTFYGIPQLYPFLDKPFVMMAPPVPVALLWFAKVLLHHYVMSFGMYWMHRNLHSNKFLWDHVHSLHHWAKTPLARTTYMDHWLDNFFNAILCETSTQLLVPLPVPLLVASRLFRMCESMEKHSGVSGWFNVAHSVQAAFLPWAQMPHHHDWHHEGHKNSNYTFASLGGVWDVAFGTRHHGRADQEAKRAATKQDLKNDVRRGVSGDALLDHQLICPLPVLGFLAAAGYTMLY